MQRFARLLVVLDTQEPGSAVRQELLEFARLNASKLTIAGTAESPDPSLIASLFGGRDQHGRLRTAMLERLDVVAGPFRDAGLQVETEMVDGDPLESICALARSGRFDLVVKLAEGNASDTPYFYGPLDRALLRVCPLPVLIANAHREERPRVLVAVDVGNAAHDALNRQLLAIAAGQASLAKAELHVVHAWQLMGETALRSGAFTEVGAADLERHKSVERHKRHAAILDLIGPYRTQGPAIVEHLVEGSPPRAIAAVAKTADADLLVMGATPRSRFASLMLGDCAVAVLGSVECSVLLVKSSEFPDELNETARNPLQA